MAPKANAVTAEWEERAKSILKGELKRRGVTYARLAELLTELGSPQSYRTVSNKISRGGFSAAFFLQALHVVGTANVHLE